MNRGLALSDAELETLRTIAAPLPVEFRSRYLEMVAAVLKGRDAIGLGELARAARGIRDELLARDARERFRAQPRKQQTSDLQGWT
jgi:hypothetical protein